MTISRFVRRVLGAGAASAILALAGAGPASAHVEVEPDSATNGAETTISLRVPNEQTIANITKVEVTFPSDHPVLAVETEAVPGWTAVIATSKLTPPVSTPDGPRDSAVTSITWTGGTITPDHFTRFPVLISLPSDTTSLTFKAVQTYSNGDIVRWIDVAVPGQAEPAHPAPVLTLAAAPVRPSDTAAPSAAAPGGARPGYATRSSVDAARKIAVLASTVGAIGLVLGAYAVVVVRTTKNNTPTR